MMGTNKQPHGGANPDKMRDPRNQPDGSHDQDKHGRKQNAGSNQDTRRELGSARDPASDDMRDERNKHRPPH